MNDYEFDISGAFKSMEFIFRVADNKNLKYLKIQSEDFEETIECYDDEVISSTQEARKLNRQIQEEMARAQEDMANAQQEIAKAQEQMARMKKEAFSKQGAKRLNKLEIIDWDEISNEIQIAVKLVESELEGTSEEISEIIKDKKRFIITKHFTESMKTLKKDLAKKQLEMELNIGLEINDLIKIYKSEQKEKIKSRSPSESDDVIIIKESRTSSNLKKRTAKELEEEATAMENAAKELIKKAKKRRAMAKKKAKNK
jgi:hypothetical protein